MFPSIAVVHHVSRAIDRKAREQRAASANKARRTEWRGEIRQWHAIVVTRSCSLRPEANGDVVVYTLSVIYCWSVGIP